MSGFFGELLSLLLLYKYFALIVVVFFGATVLPLPVALLLVADGAFASQGYMNIWVSLAVAVAANVAGDVTEFALAEVWGRRVLAFFHLDRDRTVLWVERYIRSHPGLTIVGTRFFGTAGAVANVFAGLAKVSPLRFLAFDFIGNVVSIGPYLALGYFLGIYWENATGVVDDADWAALIAIAIAAVLVWHSYRKKRK